jgi:5-hydroxyisourate hydrolase
VLKAIGQKPHERRHGLANFLDKAFQTRAVISLGQLTTHILDVSTGKPAEQVRIDLYKVEKCLTEAEPRSVKLRSVTTNSDGRCDEPLLSGREFVTGQYELKFHIGEYFDALGLSLPTPKFIDIVVIRFGVAAGDANYHVPLLVSPFGYSTYRGS